MDTPFFRILRQWLPLAVGISAVCFFVYLVIQQDIRIGANDPQIQMAEDYARMLEAGTAPITLPGNIDVSRSLAPFTILYDAQGSVATSNALLQEKIPTLPPGVLSAAKQKGESRITWQPQEGVRLASVIVPYTGGYVLVGRNMREIESRENQQFNNVLLGWGISLLATFSCVSLMQTIGRKKK